MSRLREYNYGVYTLVVLVLVVGTAFIAQIVDSRAPRPPPWYPKAFLRGGLCPQNEGRGFRYYRYHNETGNCYRVDEKGPCNRNMQFYRVGNTDLGYCDCRQDKRCGRPLVYYPEAGFCFYINTQGPCRPGFWLAYGLNKRAICQRNSCIEHEQKSPSNHRTRQFWVKINGKCQKTRSKGFCVNYDEVLYFRDGEGYPTCVPEDTANVCHTSSRMSRPCWAGQRFDVSGKCRKTVGLWGSEDDH